jgi:FtsH-binding integral membrane protein
VTASDGHNRGNAGSWVAVFLIIAGISLGTVALILDSVPLWIATGIALVLGGAMALASRMMEQAY